MLPLRPRRLAALLPQIVIGLLASLLVAAPSASSQQGAPGNVDFFERKIRPVLVQHCYSCHSSDVKKLKGGLSVETRQALLEGGATGPAIVPGHPDKSLLIKAIRHTDPDLKMPRKEKLPAEVIADFEKWVKMGAPDPRVRNTSPQRKQGPIDIEEGRKFWAFQPPKMPALPKVKDASWPRNDIDRFVLAKLEEKNLKPSRDAEPGVLLRRLHFALIGLPPSVRELDEFVKAWDAPGAKRQAVIVEVVDRLFASPHFGERWGRHWLDVARFAESSGGGRTAIFKDAWRYRDYVIHSYNSDKPFTQFITEQLAGDLQKAKTPEERYWQLVATAFLLLGPTNFERQDKPLLEMDVIDEQIDTMGKGFLGMTIGCARCHDHKFDPIPTKDYYALAGIFKSTKFIVHSNVSRWMERPLPSQNADLEAALKKHDAAVAELKKQIQIVKAKKASVVELEAQLKQLEKSAPERPMAMAVADGDKMVDMRVCIRGIVHNKGEVVPRGFLQVATKPAAYAARLAIGMKESGRRELAEWVASADNPLTARVYVNRVWHHLFGAGLVRTVDNFGATGETSSHPALLDYLAVKFVQDGWSTKKLIRAIVLSHAYQMASEPNADGLKADPENRLLWRMNRQRLEAEAIRDAILMVSGQLDRATMGNTIKKGTVAERDYVFDDFFPTRRSVYVPIFRNRLHELFEVFDFPDPNTALGKRNVSTVPPQALYLMNSPFIMTQAKHAAMLTLKEPNLKEGERIDLAYRKTLGRLPTMRERELALAYVSVAAEQRELAWERFYQTLFACVDFRYVN